MLTLGNLLKRRQRQKEILLLQRQKEILLFYTVKQIQLIAYIFQNKQLVLK